MIRLKPLTVDDAAILAEIGGISLIQSHGHSAAPEVMNAYREKAFSVEACRAELLDEANIFYGAYYNDSLAGYSKIIFNGPHPDVRLQPVTKLERLYLLKDFYDKKLGHRLLEKAIELSKAHGDKGMWLDVWKKNERAIRFYEKKGFKTVGESAFVLTETHQNPIWVMLLSYENFSHKGE